MTQSGESFSSAARRHNLASASTLYDAAKKYRPSLVAERKESGAHKRIAKTIDVTDEQRAAAVQAVLSGQTVKEVATDTGIPMPTLYKWVQKARANLTTLDTAVLQTQYADKPAKNAVLDVLSAQLEAAAAKLNIQPQTLCDLLKARFRG